MILKNLIIFKQEDENGDDDEGDDDDDDEDDEGDGDGDDDRHLFRLYAFLHLLQKVCSGQSNH